MCLHTYGLISNSTHRLHIFFDNSQILGFPEVVSSQVRPSKMLLLIRDERCTGISGEVLSKTFFLYCAGNNSVKMIYIPFGNQ